MPDSQLVAALDAPWLGLVIGNTRLHWGLFHRQSLQSVWHTPHFTPEQAAVLVQYSFLEGGWRSLAQQFSSLEIPETLGAIRTASQPLPLYCASVVPTQTTLWQPYSRFREVTLTDLPLTNLYSTLGIDRALNLLGAGDRYGWPVLIIDAGTALTFTAGTSSRLIGGAILPGLTTQFAALAQTTAALPTVPSGESLPPRWATDTAAAIQSGVMYGLLAVMTDQIQIWRRQYPNGKVVLTGGDGAQLYHWWSQLHSGSAELIVEPALTFWGLHSLRRHQLTTNPAF